MLMLLMLLLPLLTLLQPPPLIVLLQLLLPPPMMLRLLPLLLPQVRHVSSLAWLPRLRCLTSLHLGRGADLENGRQLEMVAQLTQALPTDDHHIHPHPSNNNLPNNHHWGYPPL